MEKLLQAVPLWARLILFILSQLAAWVAILLAFKRSRDRGVRFEKQLAGLQAQVSGVRDDLVSTAEQRERRDRIAAVVDEFVKTKDGTGTLKGLWQAGLGNLDDDGMAREALRQIAARVGRESLPAEYFPEGVDLASFFRGLTAKDMRDFVTIRGAYARALDKWRAEQRGEAATSSVR